MGTTVTVNGNNYTVPAYNDTGWAQGTGNLSQMLIALAAVTASSPAFMQTVTVSSTPVTMVTGKTYLTPTTLAAITFNLPAPAANTWFMIKDISGYAETNNMTLHRNGSENIDGTAADVTLSIPNGLTIIACDGTDWWILLNI